MSELVLTQRRDHIYEITINRPEKRNAINWEVMLALEAAIDAVGHAPGVRAVLLKGAGSGFSAGIDLRAFSDLAEHFGPNWREDLLPITRAMQAVLNKYERSSIPTIALLHGFSLGLGFELALACDIRIAAQNTQIGLPETHVGLIPDVGGTTRLTRLIGPARAKEYILTGRSLELEKAAEWGVVNSIVAAEELDSRGAALANEIALAAPIAVRYAKRVIDGISDIDRGLQLEAFAQAQLIQTDDFEAGVQAMLLKQQPTWKGK